MAPQGDFVANVHAALKGQEAGLLTLPDLAKAIGDLPESALTKIEILVNADQAGLGEVPFTLVPHRKRGNFGVDFPQLLRSEVKTKSNGKDVVQKNYWPAVMLKDAKLDERASLRRALGEAIAKLPEAANFDVKVRGADIVITHK